MSSYLSPVIQHNDQRIFVKGSIKEKEIDFLLDTGAEITVIPTKLAQGLNIPYKKSNGTWRLTIDYRVANRDGYR